jgi:hypothetical protein
MQNIYAQLLLCFKNKDRALYVHYQRDMHNVFISVE